MDDLRWASRETVRQETAWRVLQMARNIRLNANCFIYDLDKLRRVELIPLGRNENAPFSTEPGRNMFNIPALSDEKNHRLHSVPGRRAVSCLPCGMQGA